MNAGILPLLLLSATLGLALSRASERGAWIAIGAAIATALAVAILPVPTNAQPVVFAGLWVSMILTAIVVYLPKGISRRFAIIAPVNAGIWAGALFALSPGLPASALAAVPLFLLFYPGRWLAARGYGVAVKVAASWMIAIASLSLFVSATPTPGYVQDHME